MERKPLNTLREGQAGRIAVADGASRRLTDLGLIEGAPIKCLYKSPLKDPVAYELRGAVIALRNEDCDGVLVDVEEKEKDDGPWQGADRRMLHIALAGNPNVGKSTVFNCLTGMRQHTGNWAGKTVKNAEGIWQVEREGESVAIRLLDIPGCYSLEASSQEEEVARDFVCSKDCDGVIVVCDGTCLERNLILVLQIMKFTRRVGICINLMDQVRKRKLKIDVKGLSQHLGVPVVTTEARKKKEMKEAMNRLVLEMAEKWVYGLDEETRPGMVSDTAGAADMEGVADTAEAKGAADTTGVAEGNLQPDGYRAERLGDPKLLVLKAEELARQVVDRKNERADVSRRIDRVLTNPVWGFPVMGILLLVIFWITMKGANYPSALFSQVLFSLEGPLCEGMISLGLPQSFCEMIACGMYRVLAWVVSVMLPPMAIFFPLFTLLEDWGLLPRIAFNLDRCFHCCKACGKQALTMCMGFGCNASGVVGCRIIDSKREQLLAMLTNSLVPCNGRFPILIAIITMFFAGEAGSGGKGGVIAPVLLTLVILLGVGATLLLSKILSATLLKGVPSSFTLELPPFRKPDFVSVIIRSVLDRTVFVLGRAVVVAAPAGLIIWLLANIQTGGGENVLTVAAGWLDPLGRAIGLDGVILMAFILGLPANEIVIPIMLMIYMSQGTLMEVEDMNFFRQLLIDNGWTTLTAVNVLIFTLMHWPCATTLLSIKKESGSLKWTVIAALAPLMMGTAFCALTKAFACIIG